VDLGSSDDLETGSWAWSLKQTLSQSLDVGFDYN
jgi:hypothetical protein